MKLIAKTFIIIALVLGVFGQYTAASAADVIATKASAAYAYFYGGGGCVTTSIFVQGIDEIYKTPPGPGEATSSVFLSIYQDNWCAGQMVYLFGSTPVDDKAVVVDKKLGWTTLDTTVSVYDIGTQSNTEVDVALTWTATGELVPTKLDYVDHTPGCHWISRSKGLGREAEASGTITYSGTTLTVDNSWTAEMFSSKAGDITVGCE